MDVWAVGWTSKAVRLGVALPVTGLRCSPQGQSFAGTTVSVEPSVSFIALEQAFNYRGVDIQPAALADILL